MCPFAALFFAATLVLSVIWCLLCCWCPFCPEFLQHPRKWFFKTKPEALLWKLEDTTLKNKKKNWNSDDEWEFINHSQSTILIKNLSKNKILTMDDYRNVDFIAMEIDQDEKLNIQWRIGPRDEDGYFNLINNSTKKMLKSSFHDDFNIFDPEKDTIEEPEANVDATICEKTNSESNNVLQSEADIKCQMNFESEIPPPSYKEATVQRWKNLRLQVKTARAFSAQLATKEPEWYKANVAAVD